MTVLSQFAGLGGAHIVKGFVHLGNDVKAIENIQSIGAALTDDSQIGFPHVLAGDDVELDEIEQLLIALQRAGYLSRIEVVRSKRIIFANPSRDLRSIRRF